MENQTEQEETVQENTIPENVAVPEESAEEGYILTTPSVYHLINAAPWMKFMSIMGFIGCGFLVFLAFYIFGTTGSHYNNGYGYIIGFVYLVMALIIYIPNSYLFNNAKSIKTFGSSGDTTWLENAFDLQRKYWKFMGILVIVYISFIILFLVIIWGIRY